MEFRLDSAFVRQTQSMAKDFSRKAKYDSRFRLLSQNWEKDGKIVLPSSAGIVKIVVVDIEPGLAKEVKRLTMASLKVAQNVYKYTIF